MAGYSARQSTFTTGDTITAAHSNNEFNAVLAAFHVSTGHKHDGSTAGDGGPISTLFSNAISMGTGADTDIALTFNANTNDGVLTWMEDEDYFQFSDDILISTTEKLQFRDTAIYINSSADGQLDLVADTEIQIAATTIDINGNVDISGSLTLGGTAITSTAAELNIMDGGTSATSTTVADADRVVYNDAGTMKQVAVTDLDTYISATSKTLTNKTLTSPVLNTGISGTAVLDEDDMSSNSATQLATQQSIKAYVDATVTAEDLDVTSDSGTIAIDLDSETLTIAGGTGLASSATSNTVTLAIDSTVATLTGSQTLTNKTLTSPVLDTGVSGTAVLDEDNLASDSATKLATQQSIKAYVDGQVGGVSTTWTLEDDDGTEVGVASGKEVKFIGSGITTNWTDTDNGTDADPYDMTFTVDAAQTGITSLLAADIKIGEDNETKIDFEEANEIHFYAANAEQVYVADGIFGPETDSDVDLGSTGVRWKDAFVDSLTITDNITVGGDLTVNGTTTTVNSTTVTIDDPIFTLGGDSAPGSDDNKDRGIEFRWHNGSAAKVGFFGYDDNAAAFTFIPDATNSSEVFSGSVGNAIFNNVTGTLQTAAQTNITSVGALDGGSITSNFGTIDTGASTITTTGLISGGSLDIDNVLISGTTIGHTDDTDLMTLSNGGLVVAGTLEATGNITGTLATAAQTNITSVGALDAGSITSNFGAINVGSSNITTTGTVSGTNVAGTLTTAAQTNVTSTGALDGGSITAGFGAIDNGTSGIRTNTFTAETSVVPDASGGADLGSTSLEWGDLYIADDKKIYLGSDQDVSIEYDEDGNDTTAVVAAGGVSFAPHGTGTGNGTELRFQELAANGANYVGFKSPDAISSNEVWVLPNADGSDGQVLKTDGSNALSWADAGGGGTVDKVADGDIAIRKPVILTAAGKAKQIAFSDAAAGVGTAVTLDSSVDGSDNRTNLVYMDGVGSGVKTFVKIFCDGGTSNHITAIAFTISDIGARTVTAGTPVVVTSNDTSYMDAVFDPDTDRVIMVYHNGGDNDKPYYSVISVSGTTLTSSTVAYVDNDANLNADEVALSYDTSADRVALVFKDDNFSATHKTKIASYVGTVTGGTTNSVAWGSNVYADTDIDKSNSRTRICYDAGTNRHLLIYTDSDGLQSRVGTLTGSSTNTLAWGDQTTLHTAFAQYDVAVTYEATQAKCVVSFSNGSTTQSLGVVTVTGSSTNTAAIGSLVTISRDDAAGAPNSNAISAIAASKVGYVYNVSNTVKVTPFTISGTSLSAGTAVTIASADTSNTQIAGVVATGAAAITFETTNTTISAVEFRSATISGGGTSPLTKDNYLGISKAAISDGATGKIVIPGGISEGHSSLTIGSRVFTNGAGDIGLAGDSAGFEFLGEAISATEIQLQDREFEFYAEADGAVTKGAPIDVASGKIKNIVGNSMLISDATSVHSISTQIYTKPIYDPDTERVIFIYKGASNYITATVIKSSGTGIDTVGTPVVVASETLEGLAEAEYDPDTNRIIVGWQNGSRRLRYAVGTVTGGTTNNTAWGTVGDIEASNDAYSFQMCYDTAADRLLVVRVRGAGSNDDPRDLKYHVGTVTGGTTNTISWTGLGAVRSGNGVNAGYRVKALAYCPNINRHALFYYDYHSTDTVVGIVGTLTGGGTNSVSWSSDNDFISSASDPGLNSAIFSHDPDRSSGTADVFAFLYGDSQDGNDMKAVRLSFVADGTRTASSIVEVGGGSTHAQNGDYGQYWGLDYDPTIDKHILIATDTGGGTKLAEVTVAGDGNASGTIAVGEYSSKISTGTNASSWGQVIFDASVNKMIIGHSDHGASTSLALSAFMITGAAVASTKTNFDGFAQYAAADGNIVAAKLDYSIDTNQSGLTAGSTYYLDSETALVTSSSGNQKVGVALTATDLQIVKT